MKLLLLALATALAVTFLYHDPAKPHRAADGFRNNYPHPEKKGFWRWKWDQLRDGLPQDPEDGYRFETAQPQLAANPSVTWVGHATVLLRVGGLNVLTDPHFSERASPISFAGPKRVVPAVPALAELPHIDAVVISHNHYDHLDQETVGKLAEQRSGSPRFFVPLGLKDWFARRGIQDVVELDWWDNLSYKGLELHFVPVQHWSKRTLTDENQTLWGGWVIRHPELSFFFAGDAGYSKDFADIGAKFGGFDLAAIPDRRLRAALVHADHAPRSGGGGARAPGRERAPVARHPLGDVLESHRREPVRAARQARRGAREGRPVRQGLLHPEARRDPRPEVTKSSKEWLRRHVTDPYVKAARKQGYRSRAAFKLLELDKKESILKPGFTVVDLGAAPGGWSQVAAEKVKPGGRVIAIDLLDIAPISGVTTLKGDFRQVSVEARADVVLSDLSPNMSGIPNVDQARWLELAAAAVELCGKVLKPDGVFVVKAFHGEAFDALMERLKAVFKKVKVVKPPASRGESAETYLVARALRRL